jgi:membrane-bound serine protease (ClpP class)
VAAMAPGTNAGAAHVVFEMGKPDKTMAEKAENDAEAFLRSYVSSRKRNVDAAIAAVQSSKSYSAEEALAQHLIDLTASSDAELLSALDGREITRLNGSRQILHLANARIELVKPTLREGLLDCWSIPISPCCCSSPARCLSISNSIPPARSSPARWAR